MQRDAALRIDGMLIGVQGNLNCIVHYLKNNLSQEEYKEHAFSVAKSMAALIDISKSMYLEFPDILPKELQPPMPDDLSK
jgi:hypothetical protein